MGAVVRIWLKSLIDTFQWGRLHCAMHRSVIVFQGRARLRGRVRSTTTTTTTTTPLPTYEEEYDDYEQYEEYNYNDGSEEEDEGWEKAREMLEEEVYYVHSWLGFNT